MPDERGQQPVAEASPVDRPRAEPPQTVTPTPSHAEQAREIGGPKGLEPTRYGDWERAGRCIDF